MSANDASGVDALATCELAGLGVGFTGGAAARAFGFVGARELFQELLRQLARLRLRDELIQIFV